MRVGLLFNVSVRKVELQMYSFSRNVHTYIQTITRNNQRTPSV